MLPYKINVTFVLAIMEYNWQSRTFTALRKEIMIINNIYVYIGICSFISITTRFNALRHPSQDAKKPLFVIKNGPWNVQTPATQAQSTNIITAVIFIISLGTSPYMVIK
mmetsp:Transcript_23563/g.56866  ORF Transcript_23563/g.56866 Transcript_23563/m.56866 type:complete len:109 (+) Transcript_23563:22-348(+)